MGAALAGVPLSSAPIAPGGIYATSGDVTPAAGGPGLSWLATVGGNATPALGDLFVTNGPMFEQVTAAGGSADFSNPTLASLGIPGGAAGLAVSGDSTADGSQSTFITYLFLVNGQKEAAPAGTTFVLWDSDAGGTASFTFAAQGQASQPVGTADWTFTPLAPAPDAASVTAGGGIVDVTDSFAGNGNPDAVVLVTPNVPVSAVTVTASTDTADTWGLALTNAVAQNGVPACFLAGTELLTPTGPVPVERLAPGDLVCTRFAGAVPVVWCGRRRVAPARHADPDTVWPIRIRRDAVAPGVPVRDLLLSPDHAVFLGGVLIPVKYLLNGHTIVQDRTRALVDYRHVELTRHDVLLAEALPAESYLDTGNRAAFEGEGAALALHPAFGRLRWERDACAPLRGAGPPVDDVRLLLLARARDLHLRAARRAASAGEGR
jgi:collagen type I/II/III/V/XI/XXIV/XXVII alpha